MPSAETKELIFFYPSSHLSCSSAAFSESKSRRQSFQLESRSSLSTMESHSSKSRMPSLAMRLNSSSASLRLEPKASSMALFRSWSRRGLGLKWENYFSWFVFGVTDRLGNFFWCSNWSFSVDCSRILAPSARSIAVVAEWLWTEEITSAPTDVPKMFLLGSAPYSQITWIG